jgi:hypothetical protein
MNAESHWALKRPIPFANASGETIPAFAVMAITGLVYENGIAFLACSKPGTTFYREYAVNNMFDVPAGRRGTCFRSGDLRVLYDTGTPAAGEGWGPKPGQWSLAQGFAGFTIGGVVHADKRIAKAFFQPITHVLATTTAAVGAGAATQNYQVYAGTFGSETSAGYSVVPSARNRTGQSLASGEWVWLAWTNNGWELRCLQNRVYHVTLSTGVAAGAAGSVVLPDGRTVSATNWSTGVDLSAGDKALCWQDFSDGAFYLVRTGRDRPVPRWFHARLSAALVSSSGTLDVESVVALDGESAPATIAGVSNPYALSGQQYAFCLVVEDLQGEGGYKLVQVQHVVKEMLVDADWSNEAEKTLSVRAQDFTVMHQGDPKTWQSVVVAESTELVESVNWDGSALTYTTRLAYTFPDSEAGSTEPILASVSIPVVHNVYVSGLNLMQSRTYYVQVLAAAGSAEQVIALGDQCDAPAESVVPDEPVDHSSEFSPPPTES